MHTSGLGLSELEDLKFFWENPQIELDAVCRPALDILFPPTVFSDWEMGEGESSELPIVLDEEDKEIFSPTTPVSESQLNLPDFAQKPSFWKTDSN